MNQAIESPPLQVYTQARKFPLAGTHLARILFDTEYQLTFHTQLKRYNPWMVALYRTGLLPLFGMGRTVMLLTTRGRKSGKLRSTPIGYFRIGGTIYLFSAWGKKTSWYKNMVAFPNEIWLQIGLSRFPVQAQVLERSADIHQILEQFVAESPAAAHSLFGWEPGRDRIDRADFSDVIERVLIVRFAEKRK